MNTLHETVINCYLIPFDCIDTKGEKRVIYVRANSIADVSIPPKDLAANFPDAKSCFTIIVNDTTALYLSYHTPEEITEKVKQIALEMVRDGLFAPIDKNKKPN